MPLKERAHLYIIWFLISAAAIYLLIKIQQERLISAAVLLLTAKDLLVDLDILNLHTKKGPWPNLLEHAPFVFLVVVLALLGFLHISPIFVAIAAFDTIVDLCNDAELI